MVLTQDKEKIRREEGRTIGAVKEIADLLDLGYVKRMEAYDISNTNGLNRLVRWSFMNGENLAEAIIVNLS